MALIFTYRSVIRRLWRVWAAPNPALRWLIAGALAVLAAMLYASWIRDLFRRSTPHPIGAVVVLFVTVAALVWMEAVTRGIADHTGV